MNRVSFFEVSSLLLDRGFSGQLACSFARESTASCCGARGPAVAVQNRVPGRTAVAVSSKLRLNAYLRAIVSSPCLRRQTISLELVYSDPMKLQLETSGTSMEVTDMTELTAR